MSGVGPAAGDAVGEAWPIGEDVKLGHELAVGLGVADPHAPATIATTSAPPPNLSHLVNIALLPLSPARVAEANTPERRIRSRFGAASVTDSLPLGSCVRRAGRARSMSYRPPVPMPRIPRLRQAGSWKVPVLAILPRLHSGPSHERPVSSDRAERRAMEMWPRLSHRAIHRCCGDPARMATYISHRTKMGSKSIEILLAR